MWHGFVNKQICTHRCKNCTEKWNKGELKALIKNLMNKSVIGFVDFYSNFK